MKAGSLAPAHSLPSAGTCLPPSPTRHLPTLPLSTGLPLEVLENILQVVRSKDISQVWTKHLLIPAVSPSYEHSESVLLSVSSNSLLIPSQYFW